jgi:hypothetical protein
MLQPALPFWAAPALDKKEQNVKETCEMGTCKSCGDPATKELNGRPCCQECWDELANGKIAPPPETLRWGDLAPVPIKFRVTDEQILEHGGKLMTEKEVLERAGERRGRYINHIAKLCREHEIDLDFKSRGGRAYRGSQRICIAAVKSDITYAVALHELGHLLGGMQDGHRLKREAGAWIWARDNACEWTERMDATMRRGLGSYLNWAQRDKHVRTLQGYQAGYHLCQRLITAGLHVPYVPRAEELPQPEPESPTVVAQPISSTSDATPSIAAVVADDPRRSKPQPMAAIPRRATRAA